MAKVLKRRWTAEQTSGLRARDRRSCSYECYVPDPVAGRPLAFAGAVAADIARAEAAIVELDSKAASLADTEALARLLLRAESAASSRIEGLEVGVRRLVRTQAAHELGEPARDVTAEDVLANISAMEEALRVGRGSAAITPEDLLAVHAALLRDTRLADHAGVLRTRQNWVGGSDFNPCSASFVSPPPEEVPTLFHDLARFCNDDTLPPVAHAAIAHAQFETIHPFVDGNGRAGRALIHLILARRGLARRVAAPVSLVLATFASDYVAGLTAYRYRGAASTRAAAHAVDEWVGFFSSACIRAASDALAYEARVAELEASWRRRLGKTRAGSSVDLLLGVLPGAPVLTVRTAAGLLGRTTVAANGAINRLVDAGILSQVTVGRRNRAYEAAEALDAFTDLERTLASPVADTRAAGPARIVPKNRK